MRVGRSRLWFGTLGIAAAIAAAAPGLSRADETVRHVSGSSWTWPGRDAALDDYLASGAESLTARTAAPPTDATGGFAFPLRLMSRYGTYVDLVPPAEIDALVRLHSARIQLTPELGALLRMVAADRWVFSVLENFLRSGGTLAPVATGGRYTPAPLRIIVGIAPGQDPIDAGKTLFHELLHYAFDKIDSILAEVEDRGGADHYAIAALEERFLIIQSLAAGKLPLTPEFGSLYGFTRLGKVGGRLDGLARDVSDAARYVDTEEYRTTFVHSALVTPLSSRAVHSREGGGYVLTGAQIADLASLAAYHSAMLAGGLEIAAALGPGRPVAAAFRLPGFMPAFRAFLAGLVARREREPRGSPRAQGAEALAGALRSPRSR